MKTSSPLKPHQTRFIDLLVEAQALLFGDFVTKAGRKTPYFINTGKFDSGKKIAQLGSAYASHIVEHGLHRADLLFGPAYKGIPLATTAAAALHLDHRCDIGFAFDRKEVKDHGDKGKLVGSPIKDGSRIVIVEDVITAGTTVREIVPFLRSLAKIEILGVLNAVDRCERGSGKLSAVQEAEKEFGVKVYPIVTIHEIVGYLSQPNPSNFILTNEINVRIASYLKEYGI